MIDFGRVITAMVTPFDNNGDIDYPMVKKLAKKLADEGSDSIVVTGTTGESPTLTHEEDLLLYAKVLDEVGDRVKVIAGTGSNSTATSIKYTKMAESIGVHGAMIVVPYYNKPSQEGMFAHFSKIAQNTTLPLIMYNIPGRTGVNMLPETVIKITEANANYVAIKEASGNIEQMSQIIKNLEKNKIKLYSGDDGLTYEVLEIGGYGVISVASHIVGKDLQEMVKSFVSGDKKTARGIHERLGKLFKVLFITSNPAPVKEALALTGYKVGSPRLPLLAVTKAESKQIEEALKELKII